MPESLFCHCFYASCFSEFNIFIQFTRAGHTQKKENALMITSTITVVLFSTAVRISFQLEKLHLNFPRQHKYSKYDLCVFVFV